jgi:hypothetical protein
VRRVKPYIDVAHREHAVAETGGIRAAKAMGLRRRFSYRAGPLSRLI